MKDNAITKQVLDCYKHTNSKDSEYFLHKANVKLTNGKVQTVYFFRRSVDLFGTHTPCQLPDDREVRENPRNGFCTVVRRKK